MTSNSVSRRYHQTLQGYLRWKPEGCLFRPTFEYVVDGVPAAVAMRDWESYGTSLPAGCAEPDLLADYVQSKRSRDWHITEWKLGIKQELFHPCEFVGTFGLTWAECKKLLSVP